MRDHVERLIGRDEMHVVEREVDPRHELAAVIMASQARDDLPILFRRVRGSAMPVVSNLYGSRRRTREMVGAADGSFPRRWLDLCTGMQPGSESFLKRVPMAADLRDSKMSSLPQVTY